LAKIELIMKKENSKISNLCPICNVSSHVDYQPFCSRRCADKDLLKWLNGEYYIPSIELLDLDDNGGDGGIDN
jgi:uncharacterized protein